MQKVDEYIKNRLAGENKMNSALKANYSENVSRKPSIVENTQQYALRIQSILHTNSETLQEVMNEYYEIVNTKPVDWVKAKQAIDVAEKQTKVHDVLTPKITLKESQDKNGNITRTAWSQNASQVQKVMTSEE